MWCCHCQAGEFQLCRLIWLHSAGCPLIQTEELTQAPWVNMPFFFPFAGFQAADTFLCKSRCCCLLMSLGGEPIYRKLLHLMFLNLKLVLEFSALWPPPFEIKTSACIHGITLCWRLLGTWFAGSFPSKCMFDLNLLFGISFSFSATRLPD